MSDRTFDRMFVQAEVDYRRQVLTRGRSSKRRRSQDRTRIPFVAGTDETAWRAR